MAADRFGRKLTHSVSRPRPAELRGEPTAGCSSCLGLCAPGLAESYVQGLSSEVCPGYPPCTRDLRAEICRHDFSRCHFCLSLGILAPHSPAQETAYCYTPGCLLAQQKPNQVHIHAPPWFRGHHQGPQTQAILITMSFTARNPLAILSGPGMDI